MAITEEDAAQNLVQVKNEVINLIVQELGVQKTKWESKFDAMADAYEKAIGQVNTVIQAVKSDQKAGEDLILVAVSLVAGKAVGWLAPIAKDKLMSAYPVRWRDMFVDDEYYAYATAAPGTVRASYFGNVINPGLSLVTSGAIRKLFPQGSNGDSFEAPRKSGYISFRTELKERFTEEIARAQKDLGKITHSGLESDFGRDIIRELKELPAYKTAKIRPTPEVLEEAGKIRIFTDFDKLRNDWAENWFYFGNDPAGSVIRWTNLVDEMEVSLWAIWFIGQDFKETPLFGFGPPMKIVMGKDKVRPAHIIFKRLVSGLGQTGLIDLEYNSHSSLGAAGLGVGKVLEAGGGAIGPRDLPKLMNWAKSRPNPDKLGRSLFKKRAIGTLRDKNSIFN